MSILDLPIEKQKQIAANLGQPFDAWVGDMKKVLEAAKNYPKPHEQAQTNGDAP
jgi:hypothetical protein